MLCGSAYNVNVDLNGSIDDRLCVGLIEQIHQDLALLHRDTGVGGNGITVNKAAVRGSDVQQRAIGNDAGVNGNGAVAQAQARRALARAGIIARGLAGEDLAVRGGGVGGAVRPGQGRNGRTGTIVLTTWSVGSTVVVTSTTMLFSSSPSTYFSRVVTVC